MISGLVPLLWCEIYPCGVLGRIRGENGERDDDPSPLIPGRAPRGQAVWAPHRHPNPLPRHRPHPAVRGQNPPLTRKDFRTMSGVLSMGAAGIHRRATSAWGAVSSRMAKSETNDFYELVVERHRKASTIVTSNRDPAVEWLTTMSEALLAQSAVDRLIAGAHTLIIEDPSHRQRTRPSQHAGIDSQSEAHDAR
jgi:hypothetical protein